MLNLKKTAIAVLAVSSSAVFAGTMGPVCSAVNVTVPCESTAWELGAQALYLSSNFGQGTVNVATPAGSFAGGVNPKYGWGFMIEGGYHFNTGNDLNLNWYHINNGRSGSRGPSAVAFPASAALLAVSNYGINSSYASANPSWDAVNVELGQHVDFGENKSVRFHGGVEYARLSGNSTLSGSSTLNLTALTIPVPVVLSGSLTNSPTYNGFGPRLGSDFSYDWGNGLGMYANGAFGLLAGSSKNSFQVLNSVGTQVVGFSTSRTTVVPELEAKLGLTYDYATAQGDLALDIGWMWVNYFNVVDANKDFGLEGPFIGLKWMGNVA